MSKKNPRASTAYGQRMQEKGERSSRRGSFKIGAGGVALGVGALTGEVPVGVIGGGLIGSGLHDRASGVRQVAKGRAIDSRVAQARGGSAALGMRGVVPAPNGKQSKANMRNAASIAAGDVNFGNGHTAVQDMYAKADKARHDVGLYRRTGVTPSMMSSFDRANQSYNPAHAAGQQAAQPGNGVQEGGRGWANPKVQEAAQAARRAKRGQ